MLLGKIKLYDIAKEFDMSSKDILAIAVKLNIDAKSHLSSVSDEDAERIRKEAKNTNKTKPNNVKKDSKKIRISFENKGHKMYKELIQSLKELSFVKVAELKDELTIGQDVIIYDYFY